MKTRKNSLYAVLRVMSPLIGVLLGLLFGAVLILIAGKNPLEAYKQMFLGAFGGQRQITETLLKTCPYLLIGLGLSTAFRARIWNIGAEGQYYMGALFGGIIGLYCYQSLPKWLLLICMVLAAMLGGALWAMIPAVFKIKKGMNEIISTLMLNYIATLLMQFLVRGPLREAGSALPRSAKFNALAKMPTLFGSRIHLGVLIAVLLVPLIYLLLWNTPLGFKLRAAGYSASVAKYAGYSAAGAVIFSMAFSGALAGMAGVIEATMSYKRLTNVISNNYGFNGVLVALLGRMNPFGVLIAAFLFAALCIGAETIHVVIGLPVALADVIQALIVLSVLIVDAAVRGKEA